MNKFVEFYQKVTADGEAMKKMQEILNGTPIDKATDAMLEKLVPLAKEQGFTITVEEAKNYLNPEEEALSVDDLDAVAGGKGDDRSQQINIGGENKGDINMGGGDTSCKTAAGNVGVDTTVK